MIVDLEIFHYRPGSEAAVTAACGAALGPRAEVSPLLGYWTVDVGPLNSAAMLWSYADATDRARANEAASGLARFPPPLEEVLGAPQSLVLEPAPFNGPLEPGEYGGLYEIRIYDYEPGSIGTVIERWSERIEARRALSPLIGCFFASSGLTDKWVHIWAYNDAGDRQRIRAEAARAGIWPPRTADMLMKQENLLALPAAFSLLC